ncbi:MAG: phosphotransferase family protein [Novosphingobium sp.]|nr:phosphotransferase family protein [Novosphingobium sp.]
MPRDVTQLTEHLASCLPDGDKITAITPLSVGFSNETYLVEGLDLIVRAPPVEMPLLEPFSVHGVITQFDILEEYAARGDAPPTPRPVHVERDTGVVGFPFFLMERVASDEWGDWEAPDWVMRGDDTFRASVSEKLVGMYAQLHAMEPLQAFGEVRSNRRLLEIWHEPVREIAPPALREAFALLFDTAPDNNQPAPCHGDAKIANILWRDGKVVAMLDYEMSFNGDPRWDIGSLLRQAKSRLSFSTADGPLSGFWDGPRMLEEWHARTGRSMDDAGWFEAASNAAYAAILVYGKNLFDEGQASDARYGDFGAVIDRLSGAARDIATGHANGPKP